MTLLVDALHSLPRAAGRTWPAAARLLAHWLLVVLLALLTGVVHAQTYTKINTPYTWDTVSINSGVVGDDVSSGLISMGFNFPIGGQSYSALYFNSNGLVNFTTATASLGNASPPTAGAPYPALIVFWDDLHPGYGGSSITYGTLGTAPNRRFVISYNNIAQYANSGFRYTFQVVLFESGNVEYRYQSMSCCVATASVGIQVSATDFTNHGDVNTMPGGTAILWAARENSSPGGLSGHAWWSRADTIGLGDNADVVTWSNSANFAKNLNGSATRPKFRNNNAQNINFNPVVEFTTDASTTAAAQFFSASSFLGTSTWNQAHYAMVGYVSTQTQYSWVFFEDALSPVGADGRLSFHMGWDGGGVYWDAGASGNGNRTLYTDPSLANRSSVWLFNMDTVATTPNGAKMGIRRDGQIRVNSGNPSAFTGNNTEFRVGFSGWNNSFRGVLAEGLLFLGGSMSNTQAAQLESYLGVKYGATMGGNGASGTSYLNSAGGTIWTANTGYHNNIVGLGRDDTTRLNQLISRSVNSGDQITIISGAAMPSAASVITPTTGATALATDRSYTLIGDNGQSATGTASISAGAQAGRTRSSRIWRLQMTGTVPTQLSICIPDSMLPSGFTSGAWATDLWLTTATSADFSTGTANATMTATTCVASGVGVSTGVPGRVATISNTVLNGMGGVGFFTVTRRLLDHIEITAGSNSGVTCAPTTYTVKACGDAACTTLYTGGLTGTLTLTGTGVTANFPSGAAFTIASGSSSTTVAAQVTTPSTATVGATGLSLTPANAKQVFCGLGVTANSTNACSMTVTDAGFLFSVPNHYAAANPSLVVKAVKKADDSLACVPAFANVTRAVTATCSYLNPSTGTKPISFGWQFLNAGNAAGAACDASGRPVNLVFDYEGKTSAYLSYGDVGSMRLNLSFTGSGSEAGLVVNGSASFITAPMSFMMGSLPSGQQAAGGPFNFTVTAVGWNNVVTPNFGREAVPAGISLAHVRTAPQGVNAVDGVLQATPGAFSNGVSTVSNASWSEVGQISLTATLTGNSYLGTGLNAGGGTGIMNWTYCSADNATCTLPAGVTAAVHYGNSAFGFIKTGQSGSLPCNTTNFGGDPFPGGLKTCYYTPLSGVGTATPQVTFKPHHFDVSTTTACGSFSYAGQPFGVTVTAKNLADSITQNYDGTTNTSPNFAKAVSLSDITASPPGSLSGSLAASAFNRGVASVAAGGANAPVYSFNNKLTAPQSISLRATDTDGVSSNGFTEGSMALRSGRLQMSNAFGGDKTSLQIPLQLQYWSGKSWVPNSADTCTVIPTASVVLAQTRNHNNSVPNWSSAVSGLTLSGGGGFITLAAPSPSGTGTVDLAINLGVGPNTQDASCLANHPNTTGAGLPWLRSRQGNCATSFDRDPSARGTFGVYAPETQRAVHVRELQ